MGGHRKVWEKHCIRY